MNGILKEAAIPVPCIYCGQLVDTTRGQGDHVIPSGLGEFTNDVRFRRLCRKCNEQIGRSEQQLLRSSPAAYFRSIVQPAIPASRQRSGASMGSAMGTRAPEITVRHEDHGELAEQLGDDPRQVKPIDQFVVHDERGNEFYIRLFPQMTQEHIKKRLVRLGISRVAMAWTHFDDAHAAHYNTLVPALMEKFQYHELPQREAGLHHVQGRTRIEYDTHYYRALAKIAFHYYLTRSPRGPVGSENEFRTIRDFIMSGGELAPIFDGPSPDFLTPGDYGNGKVFCSSSWCHLFGVHDAPPDIVVCIRLFVGPGINPKPHYIRLGRLSSSILLPKPAWGHVYRYFEPQPKIGLAGTVEDLEILQVR